MWNKATQLIHNAVPCLMPINRAVYWPSGKENTTILAHLLYTSYFRCSKFVVPARFVRLALGSASLLRLLFGKGNVITIAHPTLVLDAGMHCRYSKWYELFRWSLTWFGVAFAFVVLQGEYYNTSLPWYVLPVQ